MSHVVLGSGSSSAGYPQQLFQLTGDPSAIRYSAEGWLEFGIRACEASGDIHSLDSSLFVGPEGELYREGLDEDLVPHLERAGQAYATVGSAFAQFADDLCGFEEQMAPLTVRAPSLWDLLQAAQANLDTTRSADAAHARAIASAQPSLPTNQATPVDTYVSEVGYATSALASAQQVWEDCVTQATLIKAAHATAVDVCARTINDAAGMRFARNPHGWGAVTSAFKSFVTHHVSVLSKFSSVLKLVSGVCAVLSFVPAINFIAAPLAFASGAAALAIDASIRYATGQGSWAAIGIDAVLLAAPGFGNVGGRLLEGTPFATAAGRAGPRAVEALTSARAAASGRMARVITDASRATKMGTAAAKAFTRSIVTDLKAVRVGVATTPDGITTIVRDGKSANEMFMDARAAGRESAANVANGVRLAHQLEQESALAEVMRDGQLLPEVVERSTPIVRGRKLRNPEVVRALTSDGSRIEDWAKFTSKAAIVRRELSGCTFIETSGLK
jgi:hypothetical protein